MEALEPVRLKIRDKLERGLLPREKCRATWFGRGSGAPCEMCDEPVTPQQIECECEQPRGHFIRMHQACFLIWDAARQPVTPA